VAVLATTPSALREADRLADVDAELDRPDRDLPAVEARLRDGLGARGTDAEVRLAEFFIFSGRPARAVPLLEQVVRREPENAAAWRDLRVALQELRAPGADAALARERALTGGDRLR
jgi:predicted Zn-dependent protease